MNKDFRLHLPLFFKIYLLVISHMKHAKLFDICTMFNSILVLKGHSKICRTLQEPFQTGTPNLLICRAGRYVLMSFLKTINFCFRILIAYLLWLILVLAELIKKVLTLYKLTTKDNTVPHHSEILFCCKMTTSEEVGFVKLTLWT